MLPYALEGAAIQVLHSVCLNMLIRALKRMSLPVCQERAMAAGSLKKPIQIVISTALISRSQNKLRCKNEFFSLDYR